MAHDWPKSTFTICSILVGIAGTSETSALANQIELHNVYVVYITGD